MAESITDLDSLLAEDFAAAEAEVRYKKVKLFQRQWRVSTAPNIYAGIGAEMADPESLARFVLDIIHPEERADFRQALFDAKGLSADVFLKMLNGMVEAASGNPTKSSAGSSRSSKTQAAPRKSAAG